MTRLPRLLDASFAEVARLRPTRVTAKVGLEPLTTAQMTLPEGEPAIALRAWVEVYRGEESLGIFRASSVKTTYGGGQVVSLEHALATLGDCLSAQGTDADGAPCDLDITGTPRAVLETLLSYQPEAIWRVGSAPTSGEYTVKVNRSDVLGAVLTLVKQLDGHAISCDFTTRPWRVSIVALEAAPSCECRVSRNADGVRVTLDDNDLCTRVYNDALPGGYLDADTVGTWGVVARTLSAASDAEAYLREYKSPRVSVEIDALDLAARTGEEMDALVVGRLCRVALPEWGTVEELRIVAAAYNDLLGDPAAVKLSLANRPRDLAYSLATVERDIYGTRGRGGGGGGGGSSGLKGDLDSAYTLITANSEQILLKAARADVDALTGRVTAAESSITVNADGIALRATTSYVNEVKERVVEVEVGLLLSTQCALLGYGAGSLEQLRDGLVDGTYLRVDGSGATLRSKLQDAEAAISVQSGQIELKVSKNGVISSINQTPESVKITASRINLSGYVTASSLEAEIARLKSTFSDEISTGYLAAVDSRIARLTVVGSLKLGSYTLSANTRSVVTGARISNMRYVTVLDVDGRRQVVLQTFDLATTTGSIRYFSY